MKQPSFSQYLNEQPNMNTPEQQYEEVQHPPVPTGSAVQGRPVQVIEKNQENPFAVKQYDDVQFPDTPLQFGGGLTESLINDNEVPEDIREKYWFVFHKDNVLTFLDEERKRSKLLNFDIAKIDILNTMPYYDYTFEEELNFTVLRNVLETKLDRALGFKGAAQKNERIVLQSQFQEQRQISESDMGGQIKEGFFKRLLGRR